MVDEQRVRRERAREGEREGGEITERGERKRERKIEREIHKWVFLYRVISVSPVRQYNGRTGMGIIGGGVHDKLHISRLVDIYFPWHRHQIEGTDGF